MKPLLKKILFPVLIAVLFAACAPKINSRQPVSTALEINASSDSMGAEGSQMEIGTYRYTFSLTNTSSHEIYALSFRPELAPAFSARLLKPAQDVPVERRIAAGETIELGGELRFDFSGLSKEDIQAFGQPVSGWVIQNEIVIPQPGNQP